MFFVRFFRGLLFCHLNNVIVRVCLNLLGCFNNIFNGYYFFNFLNNLLIVIYLILCYHFIGVIHMDYDDYIDNSDDDHSYDVEDDDELYNLVVVGGNILYEIY